MDFVTNIPKKLLEKRFLELIETLQLKPEYLNLFKEIVLDVWRQCQADASPLVRTLECRVNSLKAKRQRVIDAFLHERLIDKSTYQEQLDVLNKEIALAVELREYCIPDFSNWKDHDAYEAEFAKLLRDLRAEETRTP